MNADEIALRIKLGEDSRTEFKDERVHSDSLAAALVSFANRDGGAIIIGISDDGSVCGVANADEQIRRVDDLCRNNVEPPLVHVTVEKHFYDNHVLLAVDVPRGSQRPYRTNKGVYYTRGAAGKRMATREELLELYQSARALMPDESEVEDAGLDDLDLPRIIKTRPELRGCPGSALIQSLKNSKTMADETHPTLGGVLCFGRDPQRFEPYARITAIRHRGTEVAEDFADRKEIAGVLEDQFAHTRAFLRLHVMTPDRILGETASTPKGFPLQAVEEAVVNALLHRDYYINAQVRVFVLDNRVEIISPGRLLNSVTIETMKYGYHIVRNPVIFSHFSRLKLATDSGLGVPSMFRLTRESGYPDPELKVVGAEFHVIFRLRENA